MCVCVYCSCSTAPKPTESAGSSPGVSSKNSKSSLNDSPSSSRDGTRTEMDGTESSILLMICYAHIAHNRAELNFIRTKYCMMTIMWRLLSQKC